MQPQNYVQTTRSDLKGLIDLAYNFVERKDEADSTGGIDAMLEKVNWDDIGITPEQFKLAFSATQSFIDFWENNKKEIYEAAA